MEDFGYTEEDLGLPVKKNKNTAGKKILLLVVVLAIIAAAVYYFVFMSAEEKTNIIQEAEKTITNIVDEGVQKVEGLVNSENKNSAALVTNEGKEASGTINGATGTTANEAVTNEVTKSLNPEDNLAVIPASEAAKLEEQGPAAPPPPLFANREQAAAEQLLNTSTTPTTGAQSQNASLSDELRLNINNNDIGLGAFNKEQDSIVTIGFVDSFAKWLVDSYKPSNSGLGTSAANIQTANLRYGTNLTGLRYINNDTGEARKAILDYAYSPGMLEAIYRLYADRFLEALTFLSVEKEFSPQHAENMHKYYANYLFEVAKVLDTLGKTPNLISMVDRYHTANNVLVAANTAFSEILFQYDNLENKETDSAKKIKEDLDRASRNYDMAIAARDNLKSVLISEIRNNSSGTKLSNEDIFFAILWVDRRARANETKAFEATSQLAVICRDLANRLSN